MRKKFFILIALGALLSACGPLATPTPRPAPTSAATLIALATATPSPIPATATTTLTPTSARPTATPTITQTPTRTRAAASPTIRATSTATKPPAPRGSIAYHVNRGGVDEMLIANLESGTTTPFLSLGPTMDFVQKTNAKFGEFSPDGSKLAYVFAGQQNQPNVLYVLDLRDSNKPPLPIFSSDGNNGAGISSPTWSPDGNQVAFIRLQANQRTWGIYYINADGTSKEAKILRETDQGEQYRGGVSWSRAGVFTFALNTTGASDVYKVFLDGSGFKNLTTSPADDSTPVWSPDGKQIAFTSTRDGRAQIYVMNADGSGLRRVSESSFADSSPAWSPDGNWIAFTSIRENSTDVYIMDLQGSNVRRITTGGADHPIWSR
ncbi:MAG: PD40 domain-containing protein [Chloroflexi bacterium]|nr:PD40 domain-containing protein [Chloroflexota bacterium]